MAVEATVLAAVELDMIAQARSRTTGSGAVAAMEALGSRTAEAGAAVEGKRSLGTGRSEALDRTQTWVADRPEGVPGRWETSDFAGTTGSGLTGGRTRTLVRWCSPAAVAGRGLDSKVRRTK